MKLDFSKAPRSFNRSMPHFHIYELGNREPAVTLDFFGQSWVHGFQTTEPDNGERQTERAPQILFADVPVMIHTAYGYSLAPLSEANDQTGPPRG